MYFEFSLDNIAKLYVLFDIVFKNISQYGLDFAMFLLCLKADTHDATTVMVLGKRAASAAPPCSSTCGPSGSSCS